VKEVGSYFHVFCPEGVISKYRLIVYDSKKNPFIPLTEFYHDQVKRINENSVLAYINTLKPFFYWLENKSSYKGNIVNWNDEPEGIKEAVRQYLIHEMHCKVRGREKHEDEGIDL